MEVERILDAGSEILNDVMKAVETNQYEDLGRKIQDRVSDVTSQIGSQGRPPYRGQTPPFPGGTGQGSADQTVYTGSVERTNRKDGVYRTNYAQNGTDPDYSQGAYSSDSYRRYSSARRTGPQTVNSSSRARAAGGYQGNQSRAGYRKV